MAATLLEDLDLRGATFVVHDWGGPIGLRLAVEHRERVDRLVIMDTGLITGRQEMNAAWHQFAAFVRRVEELPIGFLVRRGCHVDPGDEVIAAYDAPFPSEASKTGARVFPELILQGPAMAGAEAGQRTLDALREDTRPLLMLWGREDPALPPAVGEAFASALGRPAPQVLDGAGHFLQEDRGEDVGALIADWLGRPRRPCALSSAAGALAAARASYSARAARFASSSERSALIQRPIASRQLRGSGLVSWISGPFGARHEDVEARLAQRGDDLVRDVLGLDRLHARVGQAGGQLGVDQARHDHRDLDPGVAQLDARSLRQADDAVLGGAVRGQVREPAAPGDRRHVDDVAGPARDHPPHRLLRAVDDGAQVEVELAGDALRALVDERRDGHDPGVVDEHVERAEPLLDLVEEGDQPGVIGHVEPEPERGLAERRGRLLGRLAIEVADGHAGALAGQRLRDGAADSAAAAGDGDDLSGQRACVCGHAENVIDAGYR